MHIALYTGDISTVPADVVCTSTNPHLDLVLGTAVRTGPGRLPFRAVIHRVAIDAFHGSAPLDDCRMLGFVRPLYLTTAEGILGLLGLTVIV